MSITQSLGEKTILQEAPENQKSMLATLTHKDFAGLLHSPFHLREFGEGAVLQLIEVRVLRAAKSEEWRDQFSLLFAGDAERLLPQRIYRLYHSTMGELDIFLVPIGRRRTTDRTGRGAYLYEAVFT